jgi:hypothetical protein
MAFEEAKLDRPTDRSKCIHARRGCFGGASAGEQALKALVLDQPPIGKSAPTLKSVLAPTTGWMSAKFR